jgi:hypothetical protein
MTNVHNLLNNINKNMIKYKINYLKFNNGNKILNN